mgnify:CR=1 FL=1
MPQGVEQAIKATNEQADFILSAGEGVTDWPAGTSNDPAAEKVRQVAARLAQVMDERGLSARAVAKLAGIGVGTVQVIQHGNRWPDTRAVARLEVALDTALWPAHDGGA